MRKQRCRPLSPVQIRGRIPAAAQQGPSWTAALLGRGALLRSSRSSENPQTHTTPKAFSCFPVSALTRELAAAWEPARAPAGTRRGRSGPHASRPPPSSPPLPVSRRPGCGPCSDPTCAFWGHLVTKLYCGYCLRLAFSSPAGGRWHRRAEPREVGRGAVPRAAASRRWEVHVLREDAFLL